MSTHNQNYYREDSWRIFRILSEFVDGFETLTDLGPSVTIFGSARTDENSIYYHLAMEVSKQIVSKGFAVITGGGPGIMEAANKGAQMNNGRSCGVSIEVPHELQSNRFIDNKFNLSFRYFFVRKVMFIRYAQGCIFFPGGFGTFDELFETLTLIQTKKIKAFPIYLMGKDYWKSMMEGIVGPMLKESYIGENDSDLYHITDDPAEVANGIERHYQRIQSLKNF